MAAVALLALAGCAARHDIAVGDAPVASGRLIVTTAAAWTRLPSRDKATHWEEVWTRTGPQVERLTFIGGLPAGESLVPGSRTADRRALAFRADMSPHDIASMIEVSYRINGVAVFELKSLEPVTFLGGPGIRMRFTYASGIGFAKNGEWVVRVVDGAFYAMKLESVAGPAFEQVAREFEALAASARLGEARPGKAGG